MARLPRYDSPQVQAQVLPSVDIRGGDFSVDTSGLQAVAGVVGQIAQRETEKQNATAQLEIKNKLAGLETSLLYDPDKGMLNRKGKDAIGLHEQFEPEWDRQQSEIVSAAPSHLRQWAEQQAQSVREGAHKTVMRHTVQQSDALFKTQVETRIVTATEAAVTNRFDPERVEQAQAEAMVAANLAADHTGADDATRARMVREAGSGVLRATLEALITDDPMQAQQRLDATRQQLTGTDELAIVQRLKPLADLQSDEADLSLVLDGISPATGVVPVEGLSTFDAAVSDVIRVEGGFVANDAGKGATNFGINITANPDVDVANLTKAGAKKIYKERYWDAIGADSLPDSIRAMAFDAAVNQGPELARQWAQESGGDLGRFMELRKAHYRSLIAGNPGKFKKFEAGWMARVDRFGRAMGGVVSESSQTVSVAPPPETEVEALRRVDELWASDPVKRDRMRSLVSREFGMREAEKAQAKRETHESVYRKIYAADPYTSFEKLLTAQERETLISEGNYDAFKGELERRRTGVGVQSNGGLVFALEREAIASPGTFAARDLWENVGSLDNQDLSRLLSMQAKINDPSKREQAVAEYASEAEQFALAFDALGLEGKQDADKMMAFKRRYFGEVDAAIKAKGGAKLTAEERQTIMDRLSLGAYREVSGLVGTKKETANVYEIDNPKGYKVAVPREAAVEIVRRFKARGKVPTEAEIREYYLQVGGNL